MFRGGLVISPLWCTAGKLWSCGRCEQCVSVELSALQ